MKNINFKVSQDTIEKLSEDVIISDSYNYVCLIFNFDSSWSHYNVKKATFFSDYEDGEQQYEADIVNDVCVVPYEILQKSKFKSDFMVGVYGQVIQDGTLQQRNTTNMVVFSLRQGAYFVNALNPGEIDPSAYDLYLAQLQQIFQNGLNEYNNNAKIKTEEFNRDYELKKEEIDKVAEVVSKDKSDIEEMKKSIETSEINAKTSEENAKTSETNAKQSETNAQNSANKAIESEKNIIEIEKNIKAIQKDVQANKEATDTNVATTNANVIEATNQAKIAKEQADISTANATQTDADKTEVETMKKDVSLKINEFNLNSEALKNKVISTRNELKRVKNAVLETADASGSYITLNDSVKSEYQELSVDGVLEQKTTTGKNKLHIKEPQTYTQNGISYTINQDLSITIDGTATAYSKFNFINKSTLDNTKNYKVVIENFKYKVEILFGTDMGDKYNYGNLENGTGKINFANLQVLEGTTVNNLTYKIQVIEVDQSSDYESYTGGQPSPNLYYPQKIKKIENSINVISSTRNLLVLEDVENKLFIGTLKYTIKDGLVSCNGTPSGPWNLRNIKTLDDIFIDGETYTLWCNQMNYDRENDTPTLFFGLFAKRKDTGKLMEIQNGIGFGNLRYIQTKVDYSKYSTYMLMLRTSANYTDNYSNSGLGVMITKGNEIPTKFEQCLQSQITANLPQGEFVGKIDDTYKDTLKVEYNEEYGEYHLILEKMLGKIVLDLNTISIECIHNDGTFQFKFNKYLENTSADSITKCSHSKHWNYKFSDNGCFISYQGFPYLLVKENDFGFNSNMTIEEAINHLKQLLIEITYYYSLFSPYEVDLGVIDMPLTYDEVTNIFTDSNLMPIINAKYYKSFINNMKNLDSRLEQIENLLNTTSTSSLLLDNLQNDLESEVSE